jgi:hypothetical protein
MSKSLIKKFWLDPNINYVNNDNNEGRYECLAIKNLELDCYLAYSKVPTTSPIYGIRGQVEVEECIYNMFSEQSLSDISDFMVKNCPQGITYYDNINPETEEEEGWWIGTDYVNYPERSEQDVINGAISLSIIIDTIESITNTSFSAALNDNIMNYIWNNMCWKPV